MFGCWKITEKNPPLALEYVVGEWSSGPDDPVPVFDVCYQRGSGWYGNPGQLPSPRRWSHILDRPRVFFPAEE